MKNFLKKHINRKEYICLQSFQFIGLGFAGVNIYSSEELFMICFAGIYTVLMIVAHVYINLLRINETKIPKWSLFALFLFFINCVYMLLLACYPPELEKHNNRRTRASLLTIGAFLFICIPVLTTLDLSLFGSAISFTLLFLIIIFVAEKFIKLLIMAYVKLFYFIKSTVYKLKNKVKFNIKLKLNPRLSLTEKLQELTKCKELSLITEEDYNHKKSQLLEDY